MTEDDYLYRFEVEAATGDTERDHGEADDIVADALRELGWTRLADRYEKGVKWYA